MPAVKIGPKHQITIPKELFEKLHLQVGDWVETCLQEGRITLIPKQLKDKPPAPRLSGKEQKSLAVAKGKIAKIQSDMIHSAGLSNEEIDVAVKVNLIDSDQAWWWHEDWQKGERDAEKNIKEGKLAGPFDNIEDLLKSLKSA